MGVKIDKVSVRDLGPIKKLVISPGIFNLIYSKNEKGKTFLTEFLIRSLFKNISRWSYRGSGGKGKVTVSGLDKSPVDFDRSSPKKLEDYWERSEKGLPLSMAKLLVVKGGEAGIEDNGEVSKFLIREVLSGINILDKIDSDSNIQETVKSAKITGGHIDIGKKGKGKEYHNARNELEKNDNLFEEIESGYAQGILKTYHLKEENLSYRLADLGRAKRHLAYSISEKIKKLNLELSDIPDSELNIIENKISLYRSKKNTLNTLEKSYKDSSLRSKDFKWLESAFSHYRELISKTANRPGKIFQVLCILFAAICITSLTAGLFMYRDITDSTMFLLLGITVLSFLGLVVSVLFYFKKSGNLLRQAGQNEELSRIRTEFKKRTGKKLTDISSLESALNEQRKYNSKMLALEEQINPAKNELNDTYFKISQKIKKLFSVEIDESKWDEKIENSKKINSNLKNEIEKQKEELYKLQVSEEDYLKEKTDTAYSSEEDGKTLEELEDIREKIKNQEENIQNLKYRICEKTGDDPSIDWEELINNLQHKKGEAEDELKDISTGIIAGLTVHNVIVGLRSEEDRKIKEGLKSETVTSPLKDITRRYEKFDIKNDNLIVSDPYDSYDIKDLSTGAVEQVMLALRIGFTSKLLKEDSLFLILDDAFQHSDWGKREIIIENLAEIAKNGWQVIYLTMDDHIKGLFEKKGREFKKGEYKSFEL
ncbi:MAG: hypothetical protein U9O59_07470 [Actinomycetota bacterium]|nr:hypothetical protein [Actinomycetota bacterium]